MKSILITCIGSAPASAICKNIKDNYNIIGIDRQDLCIGNFICDKYYQIEESHNEKEYWNKINNIINKHNISDVFVTHPNEAISWSKKINSFKCKVHLNNTRFIEITNNKLNTYNFCIKNNIDIPPIKKISDRPIIIKPKEGCGASGIFILNNNIQKSPEIDENNYIIQQFINGEEYTVDILSSPKGNIINTVPKKRLHVKNGQSFKSIVKMDHDIINFCEEVSKKLDNRSALNIQVIREFNTNKIYLVEVNPRFPTSLSLTVNAGVNMAKMLIENDFNPKQVTDGLLMVRDYKEYYTFNKKKKIFLTGGAGFIGSNIVEQLLENDKYEITVYDNLSTVNCGLDNISKYIEKKQIKFISGDILNKNLLMESMKNHDIVIHMAAQLEITRGYNKVNEDLEINLIGTLNIIEGCIKYNIKRLINASSACIYGFTDGTPSKETDQTNPNWEYGISKLAAEKYIQVASAAHDLEYTNLRFSIVYGKNEWYGRVLTIFTKRAFEGKDLIIFGDGMQERDYINVVDVAKFVVECIKNKNTINKNYNVSSGKGIKIKELANIIKNKFDNINILYDDVKEGEISKLVVGRERLNQELKYMILNNTNAISDTNWKPSISFEDGINDYIKWAQTNLGNWKIFKV